VVLGRWRLGSYASIGATRLKIAEDMLLTHADVMLTNRFGMTASRAGMGGRISLGLVQPLTVIAGKGTYTVGSSYDLASRSLLFDNRRINFSRHVNPLLTFGYERGGSHSQLRLGLAGTLGAGDVRALGSWRLFLP
ncbi:MAG TPA: peptidase S8, partial [Novosphingobium sp.]|nr:peptidase S8 [Novosphingobium sp.]